VLKCAPEAFAAAARAAAGSGVRFPLQPGESLDAMLKRLEPLFFDPSVDPSVTNKTPGQGKDILQASANNLYVGVSMSDLDGFTEKHPLNSRVKHRPRGEEAYRVDGGTEGDRRDREAPGGGDPTRPSRWRRRSPRSSSSRTGETADRA
jgi:dipeptidyl-peptidase-3